MSNNLQNPISPNPMTGDQCYDGRKIIHVDMDAFYAAVEILDNPSLKGLPIVVGGPPNSRSVVCTSSYEARKFGIRSAMACSHAYRLCPQAIFLSPRFDRYYEISQQIRLIFKRYTDIIEPLSLDEAYLDVTNNSQNLFATEIAKRIRFEIFNELGLTCSAGVAPNKLIAKIASDLKKPNGLVIVLPEQAKDFMAALSVQKIHGVGPATASRLSEAGIYHCRDVYRFSKDQLSEKFGATGRWIWHAAHGEDSRPVECSHTRQSFGREDTFAKDEIKISAIEDRLLGLAQAVSASMIKRRCSGRTVTLKLKYYNFKSITRSRTVTVATHDSQEIWRIAVDLLRSKTNAGKTPVRLVGVSVSQLVSRTQPSVQSIDNSTVVRHEARIYNCNDL